MVKKRNNNAFDKFLFLAMNEAFILARALSPKENYLRGLRNAIPSNPFFRYSGRFSYEKTFGHHFENTSWPIRNEWCCLGTTWGILLKRDFLGTSLYLGNTNVQFGEYYGNTLGLLQYYLGTTCGWLWDCLGTTWGYIFFLFHTWCQSKISLWSPLINGSRWLR